jgi:hypothetical protein
MIGRTIQQFDFSVNLTQVILWQYNNSTTARALINSKQEWYTENETVFWNSWLIDVFNLVTADDFGLSVWAIILNVPLFLTIDAEPDTGNFFGFNTNPPTLENNYTNFFEGNFSNSGDSIALTTEEQRFILRLAYFKYITRGAIPEINTFLNYLCSTSALVPEGETAYALEKFHMQMRYIFTFVLSYPLQQIIRQFDLLPRPAGVELEAVMINDTTFGFNTNPPNLENNNQNFFGSNFGAGFF